MSCAKCEEDADGSTFVEGGYTFTFCKTCSDILDELDRTGNVIHDFLGSKKKGSWVARNIREARERRARGELYWD
jgi:hypothetical protein